MEKWGDLDCVTGRESVNGVSRCNSIDRTLPIVDSTRFKK